MKTSLMNKNLLTTLILIFTIASVFSFKAYAEDKKDDSKAADSKAAEPAKTEAPAAEAPPENIFEKTGGDIWLNKRLSMSPLVGAVLNDAYTNVMQFGAAFNYNLTPRSGIEMTFLMMSASDTDPVVFYTNRFSAAPDHNLAKMFIGFDYTYTLITSTLNWRGTKKLPYLLKVAPGLGATMLTSASYSPPPNYPPVSQSQVAITGSLDVIQEFYLTDRLALRVDFRNHFYPETVYGSNTGSSLRTRFNFNTGVLLGASWYCMPSASKFKFSECF